MADDGQPPLVLVDDRQTQPVDVEALTSLARVCLAGEGLTNAELSLSFVTEDEIAELNRRFLHEDGPTDVLSFPLDDEGDEGEVRLLGDVVIAPAVAARNNPADTGAELRLLLVHGILHLLGHDHMEQAEKTEMWERQQRYTGARAP